jgi:urease accessory protein
MTITAMITGITTTSMTETTSSLPLLVWLSPAFPVGAFAYSHGLEAAVEAGDIHNAQSLQEWLSDLIQHGSLKTDAVLVAQSWQAAAAGNFDALRDLNDLALALSPSRERYLETSAQGNAFVTAIKAAWSCDPITQISTWDEPIAYPIAVATAAVGHAIKQDVLVQSYLVGLLGNLISAAVRLGPLGQTDGQRVTAALLGSLQDCAASAIRNGLDELGSIALRSDIASMQHETQYSRLFRS